MNEEKYSICITADTENLFAAIEEQHQIKLGCEEITNVNPAIDHHSQTGQLLARPKMPCMVTVTISDPNRRLK